mgnify:CR=1 FL=1
MKKQIRLIILVSVIAFALGVTSPYIREWLTTPDAPTASSNLPVITEEDTAPIQTDTFTLNLLKAALTAQPQGNIILTPNSMVALLGNLTELTSPAIADEIKKLRISDNLQNSAANVSETAALFADPTANLNPILAEQYIFPIPFAYNRSEACMHINNLVRSFLGDEVGNVANSDTVPANASMLTLYGINYTAEWASPIIPKNTSSAEFQNADGGRPVIRILQAQDVLTASSEGAWQAAAIRLSRAPMATEENPDCYLILLMPAAESNVRTLASSLTAEEFNNIRTRLRQAPGGSTIKFPRLSFASHLQNMQPILRKMGIQMLFSSPTPFSKLTAKSPYPLTALYQVNRITMKESEGAEAPLNSAPPCDFTFDRPYLWFIMPLSSGKPPHAMGLVESL